ncbi:hypothetical protein [Phenylobacterium sp. J367]|uniref:glycoside hydrolase family 16 protein n=1 Tax=Phenylobacterium sp. J367 TaxID=2898435 RepID=UPI0035AF8D23
MIYNWNGNSQLQLHDYGISTAAQLRSIMSQQGNDVVFSFANGEKLILRDEQLSTIEDRQFLLPLDTSKLGAITFQDEFNSLQIRDFSLDTGIWRTDFGGNLKDQWAYTLVSNGEVQAYVQPGFQGRGEADLDINPFSISDGVLTITARPIPDEQSYAAYGREYSSGMLNTFGIFEQKHGYFEIRAEMPTAAGALAGLLDDDQSVRAEHRGGHLRGPGDHAGHRLPPRARRGRHPVRRRAEARSRRHAHLRHAVDPGDGDLLL